jgi:hypothetical protein
MGGIMTVKQYMEIFQYLNKAQLDHIRWALKMTSLIGEDMHNRYEAVKQSLEGKK